MTKLGSVARIGSDAAASKYPKEQQEESNGAATLIKMEIVTSHNFPAIAIDQFIFSEDELAQLIESVASALKLDIRKSDLPYPLVEILRSNRTFKMSE